VARVNPPRSYNLRKPSISAALTAVSATKRPKESSRWSWKGATGGRTLHYEGTLASFRWKRSKLEREGGREKMEPRLEQSLRLQSAVTWRVGSHPFQRTQDARRERESELMSFVTV